MNKACEKKIWIPLNKKPQQETTAELEAKGLKISSQLQDVVVDLVNCSGLDSALIEKAKMIVTYLELINYEHNKASQKEQDF